MDKKAEISIIIVSWNTRDLLRICLVSTLTAVEKFGSASEIIVVDNASSDGTAEMVAREFSGVRLIANTANLGFAAATNQGIRASHGRYILFLNPDTKATESFLRILVQFLESNPRAGAAGPLLLGRSGEVQTSCFRLPTLGRELWRLLHLDGFNERSSTRQLDLRRPKQAETICGACILVRREVLDQIGLLDERFFIYSEEVDFCRRMFDFGWEIYWVPQAVVVHYGGESTKQVGTQMFLELYSSKIQYFRKHLGFWGAAAYKLVLLAATLVRLALPPLLCVCRPARREEFRVLIRNYRALLMRLTAL